MFSSIFVHSFVVVVEFAHKSASFVHYNYFQDIGMRNLAIKVPHPMNNTPQDKMKVCKVRMPFR